MVEKTVLVLILVLVALVFADQAFVGLNDNKTNLVLQPPAGGQVVVDGMAFRALVERLDKQETQVGTLSAIIANQSTIIDALDKLETQVGTLSAIIANQSTIIDALQTQLANNCGFALGNISIIELFRPQLCMLLGTIRTVDSAVSFGSSLALTTAGFPVISYYHFTGLRLAVCADATCSSSTIRTVDSGLKFGSGSYTSLALTTAGFPVISYYDADDDLKLAVCADATCSSSTIRTVDSGLKFGSGSYTSLALTTAGFPVISYYDADDDLKLAVCADATCSSSTIRTVDSAGNVGSYTSLALTTAGNPVISYQDATNDDLKLAVCADATCSSSTIRTVDSAGNVGSYTSLALTTAGNPVISYHDSSNPIFKLKLAVCADATCV